MLSVGKRAIDLHAIGEKLEFNDAREVTRGQRSEGVLTLGPGRDGPGAHIHTQQVEGFEVLSGTLGGCRQREVGDSASRRFVPRGGR